MLQRKMVSAFALALILMAGLGVFSCRSHNVVLERNQAMAVIGMLSVSELLLLLYACRLIRRDQVAGARLEEQNRDLEQHQEELQAQQAQLEATANDLAAANSRLERASRRFEELYQALPISCFCYDETGRIFEWNRAFEENYGLTPDRIFQQTVWEAVGAPSEAEFLQGCVARVFAGDTPECWEQVRTLADGGTCHLLCRAYPLRDQTGKITGGINVHMDITAVKAAQVALRRSEERLRAFHDITADAEGASQEKVARLLDLGCRVLGMDRGLVVARGESPREDCLSVPLSVGGADWGALCFLGTDPGATTADQDFLRLMAQWVGGEIERRQTQEAIRESEGRFRSAIESMQEGFIVQDRDGTILLCNGAAERILKVPAEGLLHQTFGQLGWHSVREDGTEFPRSEQPSRVALETGQAQRDVVLGTQSQAGAEVLWLSLNAAPLYHAGEEAPYAAVLTFTDITERRRQEAQIASNLEQIRHYNATLELQKQEVEAQKRTLERANTSLEVANATLESLATRDGLTGLKNHRAFQERLEQEVCRAHRYALPLSLVLLDVDHFKQYNDTYGHPAGDEVLKVVACLLEENERQTDLAARHGGEEFAIILPNTGAEGARVVAERVRAALADWEWPRRRVTASLGIGTLTPAMSDRAALTAAADQALYRAKGAGRDRAVHAADALFAPAPYAPVPPAEAVPS